MTVSWTWSIEAYLSSSWTAISDVLADNHDVTAWRGIEGGLVNNRVGGIGSLAFYLDNSEANSGGLLGYYSPDHTNCRTDFARGLPVRLKLTSGGSTLYLLYELAEIEPGAGQFKQRETYCLAVDYMQRLSKYKPTGIPVQEDKRPDQLVQTVLDAMDTAPENTSLATDPLVFPLAFHSERNERATGMSLISKVAMSALGYAFVDGDSTDGETFKYQTRHTRAAGALAATLSDTMSRLTVRRSNANQYERVVCQIHPANVDEGQDTVLAELQQELKLAAGETITVKLRYRDPNGATRISAKNLLTTLVADTHYRMSSASDDGGNDLNANLSITITDGGNEAAVTLENTGGVTGYINLLKVVGDGIYLYDPIDVVVEAANPETVLNFDLYYQADYYVAKDFTTAIYNQVAADVSDVESVAFYADANSTLMGYALTCGIGARIALEETATGLDREFFINKVTWRVQQDGRLMVEWLLEPGWATANFMILNDTTAGVLDDTDYVLAF